MQAPAPNGFLVQIMPYLVGFLALVIPAFGTWLVSKLNTNHTNQVAIGAKVDTIETHTNGMLTALQGKVDAQDLAAKNLADITAKDKIIALGKKENQ
jgi:hypothetical protein